MWSIGFGSSSSSDSTDSDSAWESVRQETKVPQEDASKKWPFAIRIPDAAFMYCNRSNSVPNLGATSDEKATWSSTSSSSSESSSGRTSLYISRYGPIISALFNNTDHTIDNNTHNDCCSSPTLNNTSNLSPSTTTSSSYLTPRFESGSTGSSDLSFHGSDTSKSSSDVNSHCGVMNFSEEKATSDNDTKDSSFYFGGLSDKRSEEKQKDGHFVFAHPSNDNREVDSASVIGPMSLANSTETQHHHQCYEADRETKKQNGCISCAVM